MPSRKQDATVKTLTNATLPKTWSTKFSYTRTQVQTAQKNVKGHVRDGMIVSGAPFKFKTVSEFDKSLDEVTSSPNNENPSWVNALTVFRGYAENPAQKVIVPKPYKAPDYSEWNAVSRPTNITSHIDAQIEAEEKASVYKAESLLQFGQQWAATLSQNDTPQEEPDFLGDALDEMFPSAPKPKSEPEPLDTRKYYGAIPDPEVSITAYNAGLISELPYCTIRQGDKQWPTAPKTQNTDIKGWALTGIPQLSATDRIAILGHAPMIEIPGWTRLLKRNRSGNITLISNDEFNNLVLGTQDNITPVGTNVNPLVRIAHTEEKQKQNLPSKGTHHHLVLRPDPIVYFETLDQYYRRVSGTHPDKRLSSRKIRETSQDYAGRLFENATGIPAIFCPPRSQSRQSQLPYMSMDSRSLRVSAHTKIIGKSHPLTKLFKSLNQAKPVDHMLDVLKPREMKNGKLVRKPPFISLAEMKSFGQSISRPHDMTQTVTQTYFTVPANSFQPKGSTQPQPEMSPPPSSATPRTKSRVVRATSSANPEHPLYGMYLESPYAIPSYNMRVQPFSEPKSMHTVESEALATQQGHIAFAEYLLNGILLTSIFGKVCKSPNAKATSKIRAEAQGQPHAESGSRTAKVYGKMQHVRASFPEQLPDTQSYSEGYTPVSKPDLTNWENLTREEQRTISVMKAPPSITKRKKRMVYDPRFKNVFREHSQGFENKVTPKSHPKRLPPSSKVSSQNATLHRDATQAHLEHSRTILEITAEERKTLTLPRHKRATPRQSPKPKAH